MFYVKAFFDLKLKNEIFNTTIRKKIPTYKKLMTKIVLNFVQVFLGL